MTLDNMEWFENTSDPNIWYERMENVRKRVKKN